MTIFVTGGAGFIGTNFILNWFEILNEPIINLDALSYAGNPENLSELDKDASYTFIKGDIRDTKLTKQLLDKYKPRAIINFAAESHVDRALHNPQNFVQTNTVGTFHLLETCRLYWNKLNAKEKLKFRFLHISTDEVYGSLEQHEPSFTENSCYKPNNPYSASKASADHFVRSYFQTYSLPVLTTNCSNNYGPYQFPEKLIPLIIHNALTGKPLPIYGDGQQVRDWLFVSDHCSAIRCVLENGKTGEVYNIGGQNEKTNLEIVNSVCNILDQLKPKAGGDSYKTQIEFIKNRAGHDQRYSIDTTKIEQELGWNPVETYKTGIQKTVEWYLSNEHWIKSITDGTYSQWIEKHYKPYASITDKKT